MSTDPEHPQSRDLTTALSPMTCANGYVYHGQALGHALPHVAAAIVDHLLARGWTPPRSPDDTDHLRIDRHGITVGGNPIPAPVDTAVPVRIHQTPDYATVDVRLIALAGISTDDDHTEVTTERDGSITVDWKDTE